MSWLPNQNQVLRYVIPLVYARRKLTFGILMAITVFMGWHALQVGVDAGFEKQIPVDHPYMQVFKKYEKSFGGANLVSIALVQQDGEIYNEHFLQRLKDVTDAVFFLPGVDRSRVTSLFTPGVRYIEIVEDGFSGGDVVPRDYQPTPAMLAKIRSNVAKAGIIGRLVANDQRGAMIVAELLERHPVTGERLDYRQVASELEKIRQQYQDDSISIHIIGFAKIIGDVTDASLEVVEFFALALALTLLLLWIFCGSFRLSLLPLGASLAAVVWEFGLLHLAGYGLDPFAILVPFLILSIGVSHGVQYINGWGNEVAEHSRSSFDASLETFRRLAIPGTTAIITNVIGFATLAFIQIPIVQEMAINAALGMAAVIVSNKMMLPIVLSWVRIPNVEKFRRRQAQRVAISDRFWCVFVKLTEPKGAVSMLLIAVGLLGWAIYQYPKLKIGDMQAGVPELRPDGRYNRDSAAIVENFAIGVDMMKVIAETEPEACIRHAVMEEIDRYTWHMQNTPGVLMAVSLPAIARRVRGEWNEGSLKWRVLPRNHYEIVQSISPVSSSLGFQNPDCSAMPILIFTADHKAETLAGVVDATKAFNDGLKHEQPELPLNLALASGNTGVMAATNEEIRAREIVVIVWVHAVLLLVIWASFGTIASVISIVGPLILCSLLTYAFMAVQGIGMKAATLPVAAFGVGIGVDDGIYLWGVLVRYLKQGCSLREAYLNALRHTGKAVVFTSLALIVSVSTWLLSGLQFQADMGLLLLFMFTTNLFGAILLLPALAWLTVKPEKYWPKPLAAQDNNQ